MRRFDCLRVFARTTAVKVCAIWLAVLAALPFTAPFAALEAADLFGDARSHSISVSAAASSPADSQGLYPDSSFLFVPAGPRAVRLVSPFEMHAATALEEGFSTGGVMAPPSVLRV
jgi:hypothetical protein